MKECNNYIKKIETLVLNMKEFEKILPVNTNINQNLQVTCMTEIIKLTSISNRNVTLKGLSLNKIRFKLIFTGKYIEYVY